MVFCFFLFTLSQALTRNTTMISTLSEGNEQRFGHVSQRRGTEVHCIGTRVRKEGAKEEEEEEEEGAGEAHSCTAHRSRFPTLTASEGVSE